MFVLINSAVGGWWVGMGVGRMGGWRGNGRARSTVHLKSPFYPPHRPPAHPDRCFPPRQPPQRV